MADVLNKLKGWSSRAQTLWIVIAIIFSAVLPALSNNMVSAEASRWINNDPLTVTQTYPSSTPEDIYGERDCFPTTFKIQKYKWVVNKWVPDTDKVVSVNCAVQTPLGIIGHDPVYTYVQFNGSQYAQALYGGGLSFEAYPVPTQRTLVLKAGTSTSYSSYKTYFFYNLAAAGQSIISGGGERVFQINSFSTPFLKPDGTTLVIKDIAFSPNGEYMVAKVEGVHMRIKISDKSKQTFMKSYDIGYSKAVSPDGRYIVVESWAGVYGTPYIYDLQDCTASEDYALTVDVVSGCTRRNITPILQAYNSNFRNLNGIRFNYDGQIISAIHTYWKTTDTTNPTGREHVDINRADYVRNDVEYLALGDSFSSGEGEWEGDRWYEPGTDEGKDVNNCHVSRRSYPYQIAKQLGWHTGTNQTPPDNSIFHSLACSGAKGIHISSAKQYPNGPSSIWHPGSLPQISWVSDKTPEIATISMIGNEIGFKDKLTRCLMPDNCYATYEDRLEVGNEIKNKFSTLTNMFIQLKTKSPGTRFYVVGYPRIISETGSCGVNVPGFNSEEREFGVGLVQYLNAVIKAAAEYSGVKYVNVENAFFGLELCSGNSNLAVNGLMKGNDILGVVGNESFHPNPTGHIILAQKILQNSNNLTDTQARDPNKTAPLPTDPAFAKLLDAPPANRYTREVLTKAILNTNMMLRGQYWEVFLDSDAPLKPNSSYELWLNSDPVHLGTFTTDAEGKLSASGTLASTVPTGFHTLHVYGNGLNDQPIDLQQTVYVAASTTDFDGDGMNNTDEDCVIFDGLGQDIDQDSIDDGCDPRVAQSVYRARNGNAASGENEQTIYVERRVSEVYERFGFEDADPDSDGWAVVGQSHSSDNQGTISKFWVEDLGSNASFENRYVPHVTTRHPYKACLQLKPTSLSQVSTTGSRSFTEEAINTSNCRTASDSDDTDGDSTADNLQALYRAREVELPLPQSLLAKRIYIERNVIAAEAVLGITDYDADNDGWAVVGITDSATDGLYDKLVLVDTLGSTVLSTNGSFTSAMLADLSKEQRRLVIPLVLKKDYLLICSAIKPSSLDFVAKDQSRTVMTTTKPEAVSCD